MTPNRPYTQLDKKPKSKLLRWALLVVLLAAVGSICTWFYFSNGLNVAERDHSDSSNGAFTELTPRIELAGSDYKKVWEENKLPGVTSASRIYPIYGNEAADAYIRQKAEARGYRRQPVADRELTPIGGYKLQPETAQDWQDLTRAAKEAGISLELTSGFRDTDHQTRLFKQFFQQYNGSAPDINKFVEGVYDDSLTTTLERVAPPGYSRHHSGYILDIGDGANKRFAQNFRGSPAQVWLADNNYENAKRYGFVPSYPDDVTYQGPNPEPWEFAWVGERSLTYDAIVEVWTSTN